MSTGTVYTRSLHPQLSKQRCANVSTAQDHTIFLSFIEARGNCEQKKQKNPRPTAASIFPRQAVATDATHTDGSTA